MTPCIVASDVKRYIPAPRPGSYGGKAQRTLDEHPTPESAEMTIIDPDRLLTL